MITRRVRIFITLHILGVVNSNKKQQRIYAVCENNDSKTTRINTNAARVYKEGYILVGKEIFTVRGKCIYTFPHLGRMMNR